MPKIKFQVVLSYMETMKMGQQITFFTQKNVQLTFFLDYKNIYRAESTFDKGNIQHVKRNFFRE